MNKLQRIKIILLLLLFIPSLLVAAKSNLAIPPNLAPWQGWVLYDAKDKLCPIPYNQAKQHWCVWPSQLTLTVENTSGKFKLELSNYQEGWVTLPGEEEVWPQTVKINSKATPTSMFNGKPSLYLEPGDYVIEGEFAYEKLPDSLQVPVNTGLISLTLEGKEVEQPDRDSSGKIWFKRPIAPKQEEESFSFKVYRLIEDEIPLQETTVLRLFVSGQNREIVIGPLLQPNTLPVFVNSPLPGRLEDNGMLRLEVKPGTWEIMVKSRYVKKEDILASPKRQAPWPKEEIWAVKMRTDLRLADVEGAASLDPQQTDMPDDWKQYPAYLVKEGQQLKLLEKRRGIETHQVENLNLQRNIWLNFAGNEYIFQDFLTGNVQNHWRLQVDKDMRLGRVTIDGQDRLITKVNEKDPDGVEIRQGQLNLVSVSEMAKKSALSAVGWDLDVMSLATTLYLPPGWKLLGAKGVDKVGNAWLEEWTLLDLFLVFIIAASVLKLLGKKWGFIALITLVLIYHETGAPLYSWLNIIAVIALLRVIPDGTFKKWMQRYYYLSLVFLVVISLPFLIKQIREALYPQLSVTQYARPVPYGMEGGRMEQEVAAAAMGPKSRKLMLAPVQKMESMAADQAQAAGMPREAEQKALEEYDPSAKIQSGPGVPDYRWDPHQLAWNGPVLKDQVIRLWLLPASIVSILKIMQVFLVVWLIYGLTSWRIKKAFPFNIGKSQIASCTIPWLLPFLAFLMSAPQNLHAQDNFPNQELLQDLKERLLEPPGCLPDCAQISRMQVDINANQLTIRMMAQVVSEVAIPIPSQLGQWQPQTVLVDGQSKNNLLFNDNQQLWIKLPEGVHEVILSGAIGTQNKFDVLVPLVPKTIEAQAQGWTVEGIFRQKLQGQSIYFTRVSPSSQKAQLLTFEPGRIPSFVRLLRRFKFGLEWEVENEIARLAPQQGAIQVTLPLLPNEEILSENVEVKDNQIYVSLNANEQTARWQSKLKISPELTLKAEAPFDIKEVWQVEAISQWHLDFKGIPIVHQQDTSGKWVPTWEPWPGEKVTIDITRPKAVSGRTMTIDNSRLQIIPGKRATENALRYTLRANLGGTHTVNIPKTGEVKDVLINGERQPINAEAGNITLPVNPGISQMEINWRDKGGIKGLFKTPEVNLNAPSSNSIIDLQLSKDRWILALKGPLFGPAVLFWGYLLAVLIVSFALGRSQLTPLNGLQWFLLATGLLIATPWSVIIAVAWFVALNERKKYAGFLGLYTFRAVQIGLVLLTIAFAISLFTSISFGLLGVPEMQLGAPRSNLINSYFNNSAWYQLQWYQDMNKDSLPQAYVVSLPLFVYRTLMLLWALWLAFSLLKRLRWGWDCFANGELWRKTDNP